MLQVTRIVDVGDYDAPPREVIANEVVSRVLPSVLSAPPFAAGITVSSNPPVHIYCLVDSPVITIHECPLGSRKAGSAVVRLRLESHQSIHAAHIAADEEAGLLGLLLTCNSSLHWIVWRYSAEQQSSLLEGFPSSEEGQILLPHRSFTFPSNQNFGGVVGCSATFLSSWSSSRPSPMVYFSVAFEYGRVLFFRAPALARANQTGGTTDAEHSIIEPVSFFARLASLAGLSQQQQDQLSVVAVDSFNQFQVSASLVLRRSGQLDIYRLKQRLSSATASPLSITNCSTGDMETISGRFFVDANATVEAPSVLVGVLSRILAENAYRVHIFRVHISSKVTHDVMSITDFTIGDELLSRCDIAAVGDRVVMTGTLEASGRPVCITIESTRDVTTVKVLPIWRSPNTPTLLDDSMDISFAKAVLAADRAPFQLHRELLDSLRVPLAPGSSPISPASIVEAFTMTFSAASATSMDGDFVEAAELVASKLSRAIERIWAADRQPFGRINIYTDEAGGQLAFLYHRNSLTTLILTRNFSSSQLAWREDLSNRLSTFDFQAIEGMASKLYAAIVEPKSTDCPGVAEILTDTSAVPIQALEAFIAAFPLNPWHVGPVDDFKWLAKDLLSASTLPIPIPEQSSYAVSPNEVAKSSFLKRLIASFVLDQLDWLLAYTLATVRLTSNLSLAGLVSTLKTLRNLLEAPVDIFSTAPARQNLVESFVEYAVTTGLNILAECFEGFTSASDIAAFGLSSIDAAVLARAITAAILPQNGLFLFEQFLVDFGLVDQMKSLCRVLDYMLYPAPAYRHYLLGLSAIVENDDRTAMELFDSAVAQLDERDIRLLTTRTGRQRGGQLATVSNFPDFPTGDWSESIDFWLHVIDIAIRLESFGVAVSAINRAIAALPSPYEDFSEENISAVETLEKSLRVRAFTCDCSAGNIPGAMSMLAIMAEAAAAKAGPGDVTDAASKDDDVVAAVIHIATMAAGDQTGKSSQLSELVDTVIEFCSICNILPLVCSALHRLLASSTYPDWNITWALYRMHMCSGQYVEACFSLYEFSSRIPPLSEVSPTFISRRANALSLAICTLQSYNVEPSKILPSLAELDLIYRIEKARVDLARACELPHSPNDTTTVEEAIMLDGNESTTDDILSSLLGTKTDPNIKRPKFEEMAPFILRLSGADLVHWLAVARQFPAATELCRSLMRPDFDASRPLIEAICSRDERRFDMDALHDCLHRLNDPRSVLHAIDAIYEAANAVENLSDSLLPRWLWKLAMQLDSDGFLRLASRKRRLSDAARISCEILEAELQRPDDGQSHYVHLPWSCINSVIAALKMATVAKELNVSLRLLVDLYARLSTSVSQF